MHIISRGANESILIGEHTVVKVLEVCEDRVKLSIEPPGAEPAYWEETVYLDQSEELESLEIGG